HPSSASPAPTCRCRTTTTSSSSASRTRRARWQPSRSCCTSSRVRTPAVAQILDMPQLSDTMKVGVLRKWRKNEGDKVVPGEVLAEVETDKATMDFEAFDQGVLLKRLINDGDSVPVGMPIAIIGKAGEDVAKLVEEAKARASGGGAAASAPVAAAPKAE